MTLTFALDCTNGNFTAALLKGNQLIASVNHYPFKEAAEYAAVWLSTTLEDHDLDAKDIKEYVSVAGPGGFSGVRTGTSMIAAMALVTRSDITTLSSLEALALSSLNPDKHLILSCLNAKRNGVYIGVYRHGDNGLEHIIPEQLLGKDHLQDFCETHFSSEKLILCGHGGEIIAPFLNEERVIEIVQTSDAGLFVQIADLINSNRLHTPIYLRAADAAIGKKKFDVPKIPTL